MYKVRDVVFNNNSDYNLPSNFYDGGYPAAHSLFNDKSFSPILHEQYNLRRNHNIHIEYNLRGTPNIHNDYNESICFVTDSWAIDWIEYQMNKTEKIGGIYNWPFMHRPFNPATIHPYLCANSAAIHIVLPYLTMCINENIILSDVYWIYLNINTHSAAIQFIAKHNRIHIEHLCHNSNPDIFLVPQILLYYSNKQIIIRNIAIYECNYALMKERKQTINREVIEYAFHPNRALNYN